MRIAGIAEALAQAPGARETAVDSGVFARGVSRTGKAPDFARLLESALQSVNRAQAEADLQAQMIATGQSEDIHAAVLAMDRAQLALQLTVAVTNRAVEAYKEITHLQI